MPKHYVQALEAILFAAGDPVEKTRLAEVLDVNLEELEDYIKILQQELALEQHGIEVRILGDAVALATKLEANETLEKFFTSVPKALNISQAAYETLAVVAYNEPVTRAQIESVRGVNSDGALNRLIEKGLVEMTGTLELPGRPSVFSTTPLFLRLYGISSLADLEPMDMLMYDTVQDFEKSYRKTEELSKREAENDARFSQDLTEVELEVNNE